MDLNVKCYWETDDDEIRITMNKRFKAANNIPIIRTSFFQAFIDGMSSLYSNTFQRASNLPAELEQNERFFMELRPSSIGDEDIDTTGLKVKFYV